MLNCDPAITSQGECDAAKAVSKKRVVYYDLIRIIAISLVVFNHTRAFTLYQDTSGIMQLLYMVVAVLTKVNIPLLFMISGALLLGKDEPLGVVLKKRFVRFLLVIVIFVLIDYSCSCLASGKPFSLGAYVHCVFSGKLPNTITYWFLYAYLGYILMLPFLRMIARRMTAKEMLLLVVLHCLFISLLPIVNLALGLAGTEAVSLSSDFSAPLALASAFFYPLLGFYVDKELGAWSLKEGAGKIVAVWVAALVGVAVSCVCTYLQPLLSGEYTQDFCSSFAWVEAIAVFLTVKRLATGERSRLSGGKLGSAICAIGPLTFGVYLFDPCLKLFLYKPYYAFVRPWLPIMVASIGWVLISMLLGGTLAFVFKKVPYVGKLI